MATGGARRARRSVDEWRHLLSRFVGSGLAVEAFCAHEDISDTSFYRWRSRLGASLDRVDAAPLTPSPSGHFVDVGSLRSETTPAARRELTLDLGGGLQLHLVRG